ncbi:unnamed protein product [Rhizophagus irregularis]|uniref:BED-type domain-containing protein n=3 Tax=Rhizophagus irregularis TaxID=588596 RepID=U9UED4_RHIID|nr:hypothetical protein GLOIN_2v1554864 [Rhizophagus irregularis DAOM 181602=DAOM 197198]PKC75481.1 DUF1794-domain-containing protein [Rhizophagus irregularis]RGB35882.1 hypothetical protein C1646_698484 [Rhizophagus diaphanus] [Rhizophagus sp. MUCL 43196]PKK79964.1 DUF1794-domain-containing protein [Rhizophagus irregularis]POG76665.1 hypothetical protein GLOIN_2v1554864 [Rhizophagus irregularis DAOM 181602=DAOM 197198]CAB4397849.1 unnamed protein product [Rhizophagus irregularis]|eukprot:XP_025183531.1 hypothetical protein GLOIN_2v1554864 [Rhizophagus irregularis DAOM 181602=DAOM 197198]
MSSIFEIKLGEPRPKTSWVWPYFEVKTLQDGESVATCNICNKTFKHGGSTSNLINHLAKTHKVFKPDNNNYNNSSGSGLNNNNKRGSYSSVSGVNEFSSNFGGEFVAQVNTIYDPNQQQQNYPLLPQYPLEEEMLHHHPHVVDGDINVRKIKHQKLIQNHPLEFLFGTWYGQGSGRFEGINDFIYNEEITIYPDEAGRGWLYYKQRTWNPMKNNSNFHSEMGYIRTPGMSDKVELVLAQPTGIASIEEGRIDGTTIMFRSTNISRSATAKPPHVVEYTRTWMVDPINDTMTYVFNMSTQSKQMAQHLNATLRRVSFLNNNL